MMWGKYNIERRAIVVSIHFIISISSFSNVVLSTIYFVVCSKLPFYVSPWCKITYRDFELVLDTNEKATLLTRSSWSSFVRVLFIISIGTIFNSHLMEHEKTKIYFKSRFLILKKKINKKGLSIKNFRRFFIFKVIWSTPEDEKNYMIKFAKIPKNDYIKIFRVIYTMNNIRFSIISSF